MNTVDLEIGPTHARVVGPPLSLAFVSPGWPPDAFANGIVSVVAVLSRQLKREGHSSIVLAERGQAGAGEDVRIVASVDRATPSFVRALDRITCKIAPALGYRKQVVRSFAGACRRLIVERGLQLVEIEEALGLGYWLEGALPIPVATRLHGPWFLNAMDTPLDARYRARVRAEGRCIRNAFALSAPSLDVLERTRAYYGLDLPDARVIPNPVPTVGEPLRWSAEASDPAEILFVGRFDRHKGGDIVIDAFAELARRRPEVRLRFVGPDRGVAVDSGRSWTIGEYLDDRLGSAGDRSRATWMDLQPASSLDALRRRAGIIVVGSRYDNFPTTVLEAMAMGCPLVASRIGGIPEMIDDGSNGLLVEPGNPGELARKLEVLLDHPDLAARLGHQASRDAGLRFAPEVVARSSADFYRGVIEAFAERKGRLR